MHFFYVSVLHQKDWGAERSVNRELRRQNHSTVTLDYREERWRLARHFLDVDDFDVFLLQRGDYFPLPLVRSVRRPRLFWATELVERRRDHLHLLRSGLFDHIFVRTPRCRRIIASRGWIDEERVSVLRSGFDAHLHTSRPELPTDLDVVFVGTLTARRRAILDELSRYVRVEVRKAFGREMVELYNRARIVLNLHAEEHLDTETRVYEALGCGAFLLTEPLSEENPFNSGDHLVEVEAGLPMVEAISYWLEHEDERRGIAEQGHREAVRHHSWAARARTIAQVASRCLDRDSARGGAIDVRTVERFRRLSPGDHAWRLTRKAIARARGVLR